MDMERLHQQQENADINGEQPDENNAAAGNNNNAVRSNFPAQLRRRYEVYLTLPEAQGLVAMRKVTANDLGRLVRIKVCS